PRPKPAKNRPTNNGHFHTHEIGLFYPDLPVTAAQPEGDWIHIGGNLVIRSVDFYIDRVKNCVKIRGEDIVKLNLPQTLRGAASEWYNIGLDEALRDDYRVGSIDRLLESLIASFKEPTTDALDRLMRLEYSLADAAARVDITGFVYSFIRTARAGSINDTGAHLSFLYAKIDPLLLVGIPAPGPHTTMDQFVGQL
ncbi:hypothetical protein K490DRAFT_8962, partial [Saccharata proteae CBS 121410]